jgi:MGT family glycosyltransferase
MSRAAFFALPTHGHVNPTLPMVAELVRRGEQIDYHATEPFRGMVERTGARFVPLPDAIARVDRIDPGDGLFVLAEALLEATAELLPALLGPLEQRRPDYLIHDSMAPWGMLLAQRLKLRAVATFPSFGNLPERSPLPPLPILLAAMGGFRGLGANLRRLRRRRTVAREISARWGVEELAFANVISNPADLNIVFTSEEFQHSKRGLDDRFRFVGPCLSSRAPDPGFPIAELEGRKVLFMSMGTVFRPRVPIYRQCAEAFADSDWVVVLAYGSCEEPGPLPKNCIARRFVPQLEVLARATAFISHGGMNSVSEALCREVPLLIYPQAADQFLVARRVQQLGVGQRVGPRDFAPSRLRRRVEQLCADAGIRERVGRLGRSLREAGGAARAADEVLGFLKSRS